MIRLMKAEDWFYYLASFAVRNYARLFHDFRVIDAHKVPSEESGGLVVVSNHISSFDPPLLGVSVPRVIDYMAKKELFEGPKWLLWLVRRLHAFPVDREGNAMGGIKEALRRANKNLAIGIFIQGTRNAGDAEALDGAAFIAQRAGVPVQPAAIWREGRKFRVKFGDPIMPQDKSREETRRLTAKLMQDIKTLQPAELIETTEVAHQP